MKYTIVFLLLIFHSNLSFCQARYLNTKPTDLSGIETYKPNFDLYKDLLDLRKRQLYESVINKIKRESKVLSVHYPKSEWLNKIQFLHWEVADEYFAICTLKGTEYIYKSDLTKIQNWKYSSNTGSAGKAWHRYIEPYHWNLFDD
jgi:hypothetical protein